MTTSTRTTGYVLKDPRDGAVRYVGATIYPDSRLREHCLDINNRLKLAWIQELAVANMLPNFEVIDRIEEDAPERDWRFGRSPKRGGVWRHREEKWILHYLNAGAKLLNGGTKVPHRFRPS
jgi:hypothetical protein